MKGLDPIKEAVAVTALKQSLALIGQGDDEALLLDSIEGETSFFEVIDAVLDRIADDGGMIEAIDARISDLKTRKDRFKKRIETHKALLEQAFITADLPKAERPTATLFLSNRAPKVVIETESDIPSAYWKPADPTLDSKLLGDDLKARRDGLEKIIAAGGDELEVAIVAFHQRFLDSDQANELRRRLAALMAIPPDDEAARNGALEALRRDFSAIPGATLSSGSRSLSIRTA